jgi:hypothetical protein
MKAVVRAKMIVGKTAALLNTLHQRRDLLRQQREAARLRCTEARFMRARPSPHDLMPLDLATRAIFRRVYEERTGLGVAARPGAHLDGLAYVIAELAPIYVYEHEGRSVTQLSKEDLAGGLFQNGGKKLAYIDGRRAITRLAVNVANIEAVTKTLIASFQFGRDAA